MKYSHTLSSIMSILRGLPIRKLAVSWFSRCSLALQLSSSLHSYNHVYLATNPLVLVDQIVYKLKMWFLSISRSDGDSQQSTKFLTKIFYRFSSIAGDTTGGEGGVPAYVSMNIITNSWLLAAIVIDFVVEKSAMTSPCPSVSVQCVCFSMKITL